MVIRFANKHTPSLFALFWCKLTAEVNCGYRDFIYLFIFARHHANLTILVVCDWIFGVVCLPEHVVRSGAM